LNQGDRDNTLDILHKENCNKNREFINQKSFTKLTREITNKKQENIRSNSNIIINKMNKWKYINMNPRAPHIQGTIKLHKEQKLIRLIVSWKDIPGYKLGKHITTQLSTTLQLPSTYNIQNSISLNQIIEI
jgi:hypothetical protein